jgi:hypothetical protein
MTSQKFKFNRSLYRWLHSAASWELMRSGHVVVQVVPDIKFPTMFRIQVPGMPPSDMVNLSRAKDAALSLEDAVLDGRIRCARVPNIVPTAEMLCQPQRWLPVRSTSRTRQRLSWGQIRQTNAGEVAVPRKGGARPLRIDDGADRHVQLRLDERHVQLRAVCRKADRGTAGRVSP